MLPIVRFRPLLSTLLIVIWILSPGLACTAAPFLRQSKPEVTNLFREEMQKAVSKLNWRGEKLSDDTLYAIALTGTSWELAWGKDPMFSLAWGDLRKAPTLGKQNGQNYIEVVHQVQRLYDQKQYRQAIQTAVNNFTLDQIGCDVFLKEPVGKSFLALGQPEQAFPILAAPFEPPHSQVNVSDLNRRIREEALEAADHAGLVREAIAFALSLLLDPGTDTPRLHTGALDYLDKQGVDVDRVLLGILQAPDKLRGLPAYSYAAADLLALRATPRLLPVFLHLAKSDDAHLRSRALLALGIVGYQARPNDPPDWASKVTLVPLREYGLSASERKIIEKELHDAANSDKYRVRASAALALALTGSDEAQPVLQKLAKDRAYTLSTPISAPVNTRIRHIEFPVRTAASLGLARYGVSIEAGSGDYDGKALDSAKKGAEDATNERRSLRSNAASRIMISPLDPLLTAPIEPPHR